MYDGEASQLARPDEMDVLICNSVMSSKILIDERHVMRRIFCEWVRMPHTHMGMDGVCMYGSVGAKQGWGDDRTIEAIRLNPPPPRLSCSSLPFPSLADIQTGRQIDSRISAS